MVHTWPKIFCWNESKSVYFKGEKIGDEEEEEEKTGKLIAL